MQEFELDELGLLKMGISKVFFGATAIADISKLLSQTGLGKWKNLTEAESQKYHLNLMAALQVSMTRN